MDCRSVNEAIRGDLGVQKEVIALKPLQAIPADIPRYEGVAVPGLCAQIGQVLQDKSVFYTTRENHQCYEGLIATGVCALSRADYREAVENFIEEMPLHKDIETAMCFYEKCIETIPVPTVENSCLMVGPLEKIEGPDLALLFCTPKQADILVRIWAYLGEMSEGFGGSGGCIFNIRHAFTKRVPTFSTSDLSWRMFVGLSENELTVTFPYEKLVTVVPHIRATAEYVSNFDSLFA